MSAPLRTDAALVADVARYLTSAYRGWDADVTAAERDIAKAVLGIVEEHQDGDAPAVDAPQRAVKAPQSASGAPGRVPGPPGGATGAQDGADALARVRAMLDRWTARLTDDPPLDYGRRLTLGACREELAHILGEAP